MVTFSRGPWRLRRRADGADLWFVTTENTPKLEILPLDSHINLSDHKDRTREWISVSGLATVTSDRPEDPPGVRGGLEDVVP